LIYLCATVFSGAFVNSTLGSVQQDCSGPRGQIQTLRVTRRFDELALCFCERSSQVIILAIFGFFGRSWHEVILAKIIRELQLPTCKDSDNLAKLIPVQNTSDVQGIGQWKCVNSRHWKSPLVTKSSTAMEHGSFHLNPMAGSIALSSTEMFLASATISN